MTFTPHQLRQLKAKLDPKHIRKREAGGATLHYLEGWHLIAEANRIFGFDGWDRETVSSSCVWNGKDRGDYAAAYMAKVRICVRAGDTNVIREGSGSGEARAQRPGQAHELALKSAETDATKRALASFGNAFGLALYDPEQAGVRASARTNDLKEEQREEPWMLRSRDGKPEQSLGTAEEFAETLRRRLKSASDIDELFDIWVQNVAAVRRLHRLAAPSNGATTGLQLVADLKSCARRLVGGVSSSEPEGTKSGAAPAAPRDPAPRIDKSLLTIGEPKRIRSKEHLRFVATQPCVICGRTPSHAHHIRYAQPRGLALKVSDEFTVPLCATHHHQIHDTARERQWWQQRNIDPLPIARALWQRSRRSAAAASQPVAECTGAQEPSGS